MALKLAGLREFAPSWPAALCLLLLGAAIWLEYRGRYRLVALLCLPPVLASLIVLVLQLPLRQASLSAQMAWLGELPGNSAAGILAAALALLLGARARLHRPWYVAVIVLAACAVAVGAFGLFGQLAGIAPAVGWASPNSVSLLSGAGLLFCGGSVLLLRALGGGDGEEAAVVDSGLPPALLVFAIALGATMLAWRASAAGVESAQLQRFDVQASRLAAALRLSLLRYIDVLRGAQGLFAASDSVEAYEWRRYWDRMDLETRYPGVNGVGYAPRIAADQRADYEARIAALIRPGLRIRPEGEREVYYPLTYIEPLRGANLTAAALDLGTDAVLRPALEQALGRDEAVLSGKMEFASDAATPAAAGFYVFVPLRLGKRDEDQAARTLGVAFFQLQAAQWLQSVDDEHRAGLALQLYDGAGAEPARLLHADPVPEGPRTLRHSEVLSLGGREWTLQVQARPDYLRANASVLPLWVLLAGLFCSLLLFAIAWLLAGRRARAERLAVQMTAELRRSQQAFRALADTANDAIIAAGADGRIRYVNPAAERCFGYAPAAMLGEPVTCIMPERYREAHLAGMQHYLDGAPARIIGRTVELSGLRSDGSEFPLEISIAGWNAGDGTNFTAILRDISRRRETEQMLETQREELARSNADLEQFAYVASHDLQEPLRMVASYVQLLARRYKGKLDQDADDFIGFAVDGALRMQRLIDDLLAYSRIATRAEPGREIAAAECVAAAQRNLAVRVRETGAVIEYGELPLLRMDPSQLAQLFQNLLGNALKFCTEGTPRVRISAEREDAFWHFRVADNGIGIDPQYAERIFVIFQRLHPRQQYAGTGIGLAICKKIVERAGGRIWVESMPGAGATFHFTLPVLEPAA
ncbi:CHASE domain-containing protein [Tahibacter harae]|uniref:histidine kinase n=1 Tax=Tahibacter harae TaxID=2963937 RepID=A0ABT1QS26_9GAMM|nr:CHASE domain-containing protein [Tahibacter harae]MCQ4165062.1 CHASE domain-containing protein [Tahibacter harae]